MSTLVNEHEGAYRRGLVLGLTMAEIITLVLFALLLALAVAFTRQERKIAEQVRTITGLNDRVQAYAAKAGIPDVTLRTAERLEHLHQVNAPDRSPEEYFTELVVAAQQAEQTRRALSDSEGRRAAAEKALAQSSKEASEAKANLQTADKERDEARRALEQAGRSEERAIREAVERAGFPASDPARVEKALTEAKRIAEAQGDQPTEEMVRAWSTLNALAKDSEKSPGQLVQDIKSTNVALNDAKGIIRVLEGQLGAAGNGRVLPPCWSDEARKPEYVFDVRLASGGLDTRLRPLPHRKKDLVELLGTDSIEPGEISDARFAALTRKMFEWSVAKNCRFYVVVYDGTAPEEKAIYKARLKTVEGHFYKQLADQKAPW